MLYLVEVIKWYADKHIETTYTKFVDEHDAEEYANRNERSCVSDRKNDVLVDYSIIVFQSID